MRLPRIPNSLSGYWSESYLARTFLASLCLVLLSLVPAPWVSFPATLVLITLLPGLQVVRWLGLYSGWRDPATLILSAACGMLATPVFVYLVSRVFGFFRLTTLVTVISFTLILAVINEVKPLAPRRRMLLFENRRQIVLFALILVVLVAGIVLPYVRGYSDRGVYPVEMTDWFKHYGVVWAIRNTGVPPADVFFFGDPANPPLVYYYFFHLTVATLDVLHGGPTSLYHAFILLTITGAVCLALVLYLLARRVFERTSAALWTLFFGTLVGGLDVIPMIPHSIQKFKESHPDVPVTAAALIPADHIDNWAPTQYLRFNTLYASFIWAPQHVVGLMAFVLGLYLYREVTHRIRLLVAAPFLLLAILGHSVWIACLAVTCVLVLGLAEGLKRWRGGSKREALRVLGAFVLVGVGFSIISLPLLFELTGPGAPQSGIVFEIPQTGSWQILTPFKSLFPGALWARILDLPIHYLIELGALLVCGLAGLFLFKPIKRGEPLGPAFWTAVVVGFLAVSCLSSGRAWVSLGYTMNNDLALRAIMPTQAVLVLFSGYLLSTRHEWNVSARWIRVLNGLVGILVVIGVLGFVWEVWAMGVAKYSRPPRVETAVYHAFEALPSLSEPLSVVKHRTHDDASAYQLILGDRTPGFFTVEASVFHPQLEDVIYQFGLSRFAYLNSLPMWSYQMLREMYADYAYVGPDDRSQDLHPEKFDNPTFFEKVYDAEKVTIYRLRDLPLDQPLASFEPSGVLFMGYVIDDDPVYPAGFQANSPRALVTAWRLEREVERDYTLFVHFVTPDGQVVGQADHQLWSWANQAERTTSAWEADKIYLDVVPLPQSVIEGKESLRIGIGLWVPETGEYQQVDTTDLNLDDGNRLIVGVLEPQTSQ